MRPNPTYNFQLTQHLIQTSSKVVNRTNVRIQKVKFNKFLFIVDLLQITHLFNSRFILQQSYTSYWKLWLWNKVYLKRAIVYLRGLLQQSVFGFFDSYRNKKWKMSLKNKKFRRIQLQFYLKFSSTIAVVAKSFVFESRGKCRCYNLGDRL